MSQPFTIMVRLFLKPGYKMTYLAALRGVLPKARAEETCNFLHVHETAEEPDTIVLFESWDDLPTYQNVVLERDYFRRYLTACEAMYAAPREVTLLLPLGELTTASTP